MVDEITHAVLSRDDIARYLQDSHRGHATRERIHAYLEELRTTQRYSIYRALKHPLYPILRKIERIGENVDVVKAAARAGRVVYASNHKSHTISPSRSCSTTTVSARRLSRRGSTCSVDLLVCFIAT